MFQSCCTMSSFHAGARWSFSRGQKGSRFAGAMIRAHTFCHQWQSEIYRCKTVKERSHSAGASGGRWNLNLCVIGRQEGRWRSAWGTDTLTAHQRKIPQFAKSSVVTGLELIEHVWKSFFYPFVSLPPQWCKLRWLIEDQVFLFHGCGLPTLTCWWQPEILLPTRAQSQHSLCRAVSGALVC